MPFQSEESQALFILSLLPGFTTHKFKIIEQEYCSCKDILNKLSDGGLHIAGIKDEIVSNWQTSLRDLQLEQILKQIRSLDLQILTLKDPDYPEALRQIYDAPLVLYLHGNLDLLKHKKMAVVGTRKYSGYGENLTRRFVGDLVKSGLVIVSGLARGIDQIAHQAALDAGGKTIAVLGSAVDQIYPALNRKLAARMIASGRGLILSEFPLGMKPEKYTFPMRNRIISGLSLATLVTEAGEKSGALITAKMAVDQGREVFAIPGHILHTGSCGTHELIKNGAKLVTCVEDILGELSLGYHTNFLAEIKFENPLEEKIYNLLVLEARYADELKKELDVNIEVLNSTLTMMELKGYIRNLGDRKYVAN